MSSVLSALAAPFRLRRSLLAACFTRGNRLFSRAEPSLPSGTDGPVRPPLRLSKKALARGE
jgi:hypothetical protein